MGQIREIIWGIGIISISVGVTMIKGLPTGLVVFGCCLVITTLVSREG